ncbi:catalase family protein [Actinoallomurus vinaceus]|uniref:Catalase family protein n=1 Tax=Actinoallomurus vinaceus TaxID=1080074 RepID=A0ABP8UJ28_9ACTN
MPSTQWREVFLPDESDQHAVQARVFSELQRQRLGKHGHGRALHRKQVAALRATLTVEEGLPDYASQGIFSTPSVYDAHVRLSNGNFSSDRAPDIRGFAIKVLSASTPSTADVEQNFTLVSQETLKVSGSAEVVGIVELSTGAPGAALRKVATKPHLTRSAVANFRDMVKPFSGFATHEFFSIMPIAFGAYAARVKLCAASTAINKEARKNLAADLYGRLAGGDLEFLFQAQFFEDEGRTPIENPAVRWDAPWLTVARLRVPRQTPEEELARTVEKSSFNPWITAPEHRPLGELMRARQEAYSLSWRNRDVAP